MVNTEVVASANSRDWDNALYWIPIYEDWSHKLQVSMYLRGQPLTPYRRAKAHVLQEKIELLEHEVEDQEEDEAAEIGMQVNKAFSRLSSAYKAPVAE